MKWIEVAKMREHKVAEERVDHSDWPRAFHLTRLNREAVPSMQMLTTPFCWAMMLGNCSLCRVVKQDIGSVSELAKVHTLNGCNERDGGYRLHNSDSINSIASGMHAILIQRYK